MPDGALIRPEPLDTAIPALLQELLGDPEVKSLIGGAMVAGDGAARDLTDPATGTVFARFRDAGPEAVAAAAEAARAAQVEWWGKTASERGRILFEIGRPDPRPCRSAGAAGKPVHRAPDPRLRRRTGAHGRDVRILRGLG